MGAVAVVWIIWVAMGLPVSRATAFSPTAEALNELAKTLWAVAYLVPLLNPLERPRSRTDLAVGYTTVRVLKTRWATRPGRSVAEASS